MEQYTEVFVGLDVAKLRHAVAIAENGRDGEVRFFGEVNSDAESVRRMAVKLTKRHTKLHFCYEAGPTGYGLHRQLTKLGHQCSVVAPSLIPRRPGDRVKTNRRDALQLARLLRAGELTAVWVPEFGQAGASVPRLLVLHAQQLEPDTARRWQGRAYAGRCQPTLRRHLAQADPRRL